jgi:hypothetical protein
MPARNTPGAFEAILAGASEDVRSVCVALRRLITSSHEDFVEVVWPRFRIASFGVGPKKMTEHYAYIAAHRSHVNLGFYRGASLDDPQGLLEGSGKNLRHIKIVGTAAVKGPAVKALLRRAIAERKRHNE